MKTKEELNALKEEVETVSKRLVELAEEELEQISGGLLPPPASSSSTSLSPATGRGSPSLSE